MNGVVNLSVLDGWWYEGYRPGAGWALTDKRTYQDQGQQDKLDAANIYSLLENEIIPLYYSRNAKGYSEGWIKTVKNSIAQIAPFYTMKRQLDDYYTRFYNPLRDRYALISADNNRIARDIAEWKARVIERWDNTTSFEVKNSENASTALRLSAIRNSRLALSLTNKVWKMPWASNSWCSVRTPKPVRM